MIIKVVLFGMYFRIGVLKLWSRYVEIIIQIGSLFELKNFYLFYSGKKDSKSTFIIKISLQKMTVIHSLPCSIM